MRILLAAEGRSDEEVARRLIRQYLGPNTIESKSLPARGLPVILRLVPDFVRAACSGHYDLLVVHFDMDDTLPDGFIRADQSKRWCDVKTRIDTTLASLTGAQRRGELKIVLMTPRQATEAWLSWGRKNESGLKWEGKDARDLKRALFGNPPRRVVGKTKRLACELIAQMHENDDWPVTLRWFVDELNGVSQPRLEGFIGGA